MKKSDRFMWIGLLFCMLTLNVLMAAVSAMISSPWWAVANLASASLMWYMIGKNIEAYVSDKSE